MLCPLSGLQTRSLSFFPPSLFVSSDALLLTVCELFSRTIVHVRPHSSGSSPLVNGMARRQLRCEDRLKHRLIRNRACASRSQHCSTHYRCPP